MQVNTKTNRFKTLEISKGIWKNLKPRRKFQLFLLMILMVFSGLAEVINLSLIIPFLSILESPEKVYELNYFYKINSFLNLTNKEQSILVFFIIFIFSVICSTLLRLFYLRSNCILSGRIGGDLSRDVYKNALFDPYELHVSRNSVQVMAESTEFINSTVVAITNILQVLNGFVISLFIIATLIYIEPKISIAAFLLICGSYSMTAIFLNSKLLKNSNLIARFRVIKLKLIQGGLGAIRDIILDNSYNFYLKEYKNCESKLRQSISENAFYAVFPKIAIEGVAIIFVAAFGYLSLFSPESSEAITTLGFIAFGAQKLLPSLQKIFHCWVVVKGCSDEISKILKSLKNQKISHNSTSINIRSIPLKEKFQLKNIFFKYKDSAEYILKNVDISISKGQKIGVIGETGSGKSTFVDILMGLLEPTKGKFFIDGEDIYKNSDNFQLQSWRKSIAHVPQEIFLSDTTISENIALSVSSEKINIEKIRFAAKKAEIAKFIESLPNGYQTKIGERGVLLSGGQRQRIGIARAIYKEASILVLDEATSALDQETEKKVMQNIYQLNSELTIIIIAHRISTLKKCTNLIRISNKEAKMISNKFDEKI